MKAAPRRTARPRPLRIGAGIFVAAGLCTIITVLVTTIPSVSEFLGLIGSMLTLAGLLLVAFGPEDERPLRAVPIARSLLVIAALAAVVQALVRSDALAPFIAEQVVMIGGPVPGLVGGIAAAIATFALRIASRAQGGPFWSLALIGLIAVGVGATVANGLQLVQGVSTDYNLGLIVVLTSILVTGAGEVVIGIALWGLPSLPDSLRNR